MVCYGNLCFCEARGSICLYLRADYVFIVSFYKQFLRSEAWTLARMVPAGLCCAQTLSLQEGEISSCFTQTFSVCAVMGLLLCGVKSLNSLATSCYLNRKPSAFLLNLWHTFKILNFYVTERYMDCALFTKVNRRVWFVLFQRLKVIQ